MILVFRCPVGENAETQRRFLNHLISAWGSHLALCSVCSLPGTVSEQVRVSKLVCRGESRSNPVFLMPRLKKLLQPSESSFQGKLLHKTSKQRLAQHFHCQSAVLPCSSTAHWMVWSLPEFQACFTPGRAIPNAGKVLRWSPQMREGNIKEIGEVEKNTSN